MIAEQFEIDLGKKLQALREKKGKTQAEVAKELGLKSRETVKQWETWDRHIKAGDLIKLSEYYDISSDELLGIPEKSTGLSAEAAAHIKSWSEKYYARLERTDHGEERHLLSLYRTFEDMIKNDSFKSFLASLAAAGSLYKAAEIEKEEFGETGLDVHFALWTVSRAAEDLTRSMYGGNNGKHSED